MLSQENYLNTLESFSFLLALPSNMQLEHNFSQSVYTLSSFIVKSSSIKFTPGMLYARINSHPRISALALPPRILFEIHSTSSFHVLSCLISPIHVSKEDQICLEQLHSKNICINVSVVPRVHNTQSAGTYIPHLSSLSTVANLCLIASHRINWCHGICFDPIVRFFQGTFWYCGWNDK